MRVIKPTLKQKKLIEKAGLDWKEWNIKKNSNQQELELLHRRSNQVKRIGIF